MLFCEHRNSFNVGGFYIFYPGLLCRLQCMICRMMLYNAPIMQALSCTSQVDETGALSNLILHMLHPDCTQRATAQEALTSGVF